MTYQEGDSLPEQYIPLKGLKSSNGTLFATLNPDTPYINFICWDGGIQKISRLRNSVSGSSRYLLGPGPDEITLEDIIKAQYDAYIKTQEPSIGGHHR